MEPAHSDRDRQRAALKDLEDLQREGDLASGTLRRTVAHFSAADADSADPVERWGRRIGRALAAIAFLGFCIYLYLNYVR